MTLPKTQEELVRRDLLKKAEALEEFSETLYATQNVIQKQLRYRAQELRRQAKGEGDY